MSTFRTKDVYKLMSAKAKTISSNVFADDRPKMLDEHLDDFVIVEMPVMQYDKLVGLDNGMVSSYVRYEIFVRDVDGIENLNKLNRLTEKLINTFPQTADGIKIYKPRVVMKGGDLHDFHYAWIQASIIIY